MNFKGPCLPFCDISKYIKDADEQARSTKAPTPNINKLDDGLWEDEGDSDDEENSILMSAHKSVSSSMMDVEMDDGVDVSIPQLHDF